jgi:selenocysteine lyase/cysteine desulfurase
MFGAAALAASMEMFLQVRRRHGEDAIAKRILELTANLDRQLREAGATTRLPSDPEHRSGILTFDVPGIEPSEIRKRGLEQHVVVSCRDGGVRASVHAYNDADDLRRLASVVQSCS